MNCVVVDAGNGIVSGSQHKDLVQAGSLLHSGSLGGDPVGLRPVSPAGTTAAIHRRARMRLAGIERMG